MGFWAKIWAILTGTGSVVGAVEDGLEIIKEAEKILEQHNEKVAGEDHIIAQDNAHIAKAAENVTQAAVRVDGAAALELLRSGGA